MRLTIGAVSSVMWRSIKKKVARASASRSASSSAGVHSGFGPSSKVRYTAGDPLDRGMRQSERSGLKASSRKGNGAMCASATTPTASAIRTATTELYALIRGRAEIQKLALAEPLDGGLDQLAAGALASSGRIEREIADEAGLVAQFLPRHRLNDR